MKAIIYTAWDGTQTPFTLKRRDILKAFTDNIMEGMDPSMALAQMLWEGFPLAGMDFRVMGLSEILQQIEEQKAELLSQYSLERAFDAPLNDLQTLLEHEAHTRAEQGDSHPPVFEDLPAGLLEKIRSLKDFTFENEESRETFEGWQERENDIRELFDFYSTRAHYFKGKTFLDFEQALELMRQIQALEEMAQQIQSGQWTQIDPETLEQLLGNEAAQSLAILIQVPSELAKEGLIQFSKDGIDLTPRGIRSIGEMAFGDLYHMVKRDRQGSYRGNAPQSGEIEPDSSRPFTFGDRFDLDITRTLLKSVSRKQESAGSLHLMPEDFFVRDREQLITSSMVLLLDLSWSMSWQRRFQAAKKVSLALDHYIRTRFPKDKFYVVGFSTEARELKAKELALAVWDMGYAFTNLQAGIRKAMELLKRGGTRNNRIIVLTDGQPTAYFDGDQTRVEFPSTMNGLSPTACKATLAEVKKATAQGISIDTFMLDNNPVLVEFIREVSRLNGGRAVICRPGELGELILVEEIKRREKR
jgi:uncharacterized protein with von Willebrand factor type A (vWA) domain